MADALTLHAFVVHDVLAGRAYLDSALATPHGFCERLEVLPAGWAPVNLADLPQPRQLVELVRAACDLADLVIIDVAPLGSSATACRSSHRQISPSRSYGSGTTRLRALAQAAAELEGAGNDTVLIGARPAKVPRSEALAVRSTVAVGG